MDPSKHSKHVLVAKSPATPTAATNLLKDASLVVTATSVQEIPFPTDQPAETAAAAIATAAVVAAADSAIAANAVVADSEGKKRKRRTSPVRTEARASQKCEVCNQYVYGQDYITDPANPLALFHASCV
jgi:hypothetical protein